jgi:hypothetical protein
MTERRSRGRTPRQHQGGDGLSAAASALSRTILAPEVREILADFQHLNTDEARGWFADQFLARSAGAIDSMWPIFYEMLKAVEERKLYADARYTTNKRAYASFREYFEDRVGRPFETWAQLEGTYRFVHEYRPELFAGSLAEATRQHRESLEPAKPHRGSTVTERNTRVRDTNSSITKGDDADYVVSRLKRDAPALAARVVAGDLTPNAAAREMGWRRPRIVVSTPERVAEALRRTMPPEDISRLVAILGWSE